MQFPPKEPCRIWRGASWGREDKSVVKSSDSQVPIPLKVLKLNKLQQKLEKVQPFRVTIPSSP